MTRTSPPPAHDSKPRPARSRRTLFAIGAGLLGPAILLWFGAATIVARGLRFPPIPAYGPHGTPVAVQPLWPPAPHLRDLLGAPAQEISVHAADGGPIHGLLVPATGTGAAVVLVCPDQSSPWSIASYFKVIQAAGYRALIIDYDSGSGAGWGWKERDGVIGAAAALRRRGATRIAVLGVSAGAAAALFAAARTPLAAIISDSSYANLRVFLRRIPPLDSLNPVFVNTVLWEVGLIAGRAAEDIAPAHAAAGMGDRPLMVINGGEDSLVPPADAREIYAAAHGPKELWIVPGAEHAAAQATAPDEYTRRVSAFLAKYLGAPGKVN
jgi:uncharacterized protein